VTGGAAPRGTVLNDEQFRRLATYGAAEHVELGQDLYVSGDESYDFFLILTATVDIVRDATATEPERLIYRGGPGDFLGELNLLTSQHVYLTARVVTAGSVVRIAVATLRFEDSGIILPTRAGGPLFLDNQTPPTRRR
jgi:thioredoxin reductase (NADPH)